MKVKVCLERESVKQQVSVAVHVFFSMSVVSLFPFHSPASPVSSDGAGGAVEVSLDVI